MNRILAVLAVGIVIILLVAGQLMWKQSVAGGWLESFRTSGFWIGVLLYCLATILWLYVLSVLPFSVAYPLNALGYVLGVALASIILHEFIPTLRWVGVVIIIIGVALVGVSW